MNLQDVSHIHIPDGDVRMIHDSDNRLLWGAVGYNVLFSGNTFQQSYTGKNLAQPLDKYAYSLNVGATIESQSDGTVVFKTSSSSTSSGLFIYKTTGNNATLCPELFTAGYTVSFDVMATDTCSFEFGVTGNHTTSTISTTKQRVSAATATGAGMVFYNNSRNGATITISNIQVEAGSTSTSFEPFVGGQPSPNPDYPQQIQTVTGEQTITVTGKNLVDSSLTMVQGFLSSNGTIDANTPYQDYYFSSIAPEEYIPVSADTDYTFSWTPQIAGSCVRNVAFYDGSKACISRVQNTNSVNPFNVTTPSGCAYIRFNFYNFNGMTPNNPLSTYLTNFQLEKGNTVTSFEPYSSTNYPLNLGSIELCKLGAYQDYIWKDGESWKVHKTTAKYTITGGASETWARSGQTTSKLFVAALTNASTLFGIPRDSISQTKSDYFRYDESKAVGVMQPNTPNSAGIMSFLWLCFDITSIPDISTAVTWIATNKPQIYYPLATATDTTITDTTLIAQLEAIYNLVRRYGYNFVVSVSGNNLPIIIDRTLL